MKTLEKLMQKKKDDKPLDENYKNAKMSMLEALRSHMSDMMKDDMMNNKHKASVQVDADSPDALSEGLDKAKDLVGSGEDDMKLGMEPKGLDGSEDSDDESEEGKEPGEEMIADMITHEGAEDELSSDDIEQLMQLLQKMKMKKGMM